MTMSAPGGVGVPHLGPAAAQHLASTREQIPLDATTLFNLPVPQNYLGQPPANPVDDLCDGVKKANLGMPLRDPNRGPAPPGFTPPGQGHIPPQDRKKLPPDHRGIPPPNFGGEPSRSGSNTQPNASPPPNTPPQPADAIAEQERMQHRPEQNQEDRVDIPYSTPEERRKFAEILYNHKPYLESMANCQIQLVDQGEDAPLHLLVLDCASEAAMNYLRELVADKETLLEIPNMDNAGASGQRRDGGGGYNRRNDRNDHNRFQQYEGRGQGHRGGGYSRGPLRPGEKQKIIQIPGNTVGLVIGTRGGTINNIRNRTGADVQVQDEGRDQRDNTTRNVVLTGTEVQIENADQEIQAIVRSRNNRFNNNRRPPYDNRRGPNFRGGGGGHRNGGYPPRPAYNSHHMPPPHYHGGPPAYQQREPYRVAYPQPPSPNYYPAQPQTYSHPVCVSPYGQPVPVGPVVTYGGPDPSQGYAPPNSYASTPSGPMPSAHFPSTSGPQVHPPQPMPDYQSSQPQPVYNPQSGHGGYNVATMAPSMTQPDMGYPVLRDTPTGMAGHAHNPVPVNQMQHQPQVVNPSPVAGAPSYQVNETQTMGYGHDPYQSHQPSHGSMQPHASAQLATQRPGPHYRQPPPQHNYGTAEPTNGDTSRSGLSASGATFEPSRDSIPAVASSHRIGAPFAR